MAGVNRREVMEFVGGLGIIAILLGFVVPDAISSIYDQVGDELYIESNTTETVSDERTVRSVTWEVDGTLELEPDAELTFV